MTKDIVRSGYDRIAEVYAAWRGAGSLKYLERLDRLLDPGSTVLDLGCGAGAPVDRFLVDRGHRVRGIDVSERMIALARVKVPEATYAIADMAALKRQEYRVDAVVSFYAVFHVQRERHEGLFDTVHSFLPRGGLFLVTLGFNDWQGTEDFHGTTMYWSHYDAERNRALVQAAGFEVLFEDIDVEGGTSGGRHLVLLAKKL